MKYTTISDEYLILQQELHQNPNYGIASLQFAPIISEIIKKYDIASVSDYGAGKKRLLDGLKKNGCELKAYFPYDPAFPEYGKPKPAELVCCIDVLEHIEPCKLDAVLDEGVIDSTLS